MTNKKINIFDVLIYSIVILFSLITLYPFIYTLVGSFNDGLDFTLGGVWIFPRKFSLANYQTLFFDSRFWVAFRNSILRTVIGTTLALIFTSCVAYAMSRKELPFKKVYRAIMLFTMFFSGGLVPYYLMINAIGLYDSFLVYIIPTMFSVFNMIIISTFFRTIPEELHEAALMDGASEFRIWWSIYMPNSKPVLATVGLWVAVGHWNSYLPTLLYTSRDESMWTLQYYLMRVIKDASLPDGIDSGLFEQITAQTVSFAAMIVVMVPILLLYPLLSKYFVNNPLGGSIKS